MAGKVGLDTNNEWHMRKYVQITLPPCWWSDIRNKLDPLGRGMRNTLDPFGRGMRNIPELNPLTAMEGQLGLKKLWFPLRAG